MQFDMSSKVFQNISSTGYTYNGGGVAKGAMQYFHHLVRREYLLLWEETGIPLKNLTQIIIFQQWQCSILSRNSGGTRLQPELYLHLGSAFAPQVSIPRTTLLKCT